MAPFRLKFRMGSSRSTSQEVETTAEHHSMNSNSSINTLGSQNSIGNDQKLLLPNASYEGLGGYINPVSIGGNTNNTNKISPPPSYDHVLEEKRLANLEFGSRLTISTADGVVAASSSSLSSELCENNHNNHELSNSTPNISPGTQQNINLTSDLNTIQIDTTQYLIKTMMEPLSQENLIEGDDCTGSCEPLFNTLNCNRDDDGGGGGGRDNEENDEHGICEINLNQQQQCYSNSNDNQQCYSNNDPNQQQCYSDSNNDHHHHQQCYGNDQSGCDGENSYRLADDDDDDNYSDNGSWNSNQTQQVISNKSSKKIYKAVAKQWGITCKMTDQCRCMECQSNYFDCEFDENDHQKTDGGLGATTPMFISEVMHGSACCIL